jgi:CHAT domain-containing protein/Tfp pilus assembly protein PilF
MDKKKQLLFSGATHNPAYWHATRWIIFITFYLLIAVPSRSQSVPVNANFRQKALQFKNRVEYDSAVYYYNKFYVLSLESGDKRQALVSEIELADVYILQRDFNTALAELNDAALKISNKYTGDNELLAAFYQTRGSYMLEKGIKDSAKIYLYRSIEVRTSKYGPSDTSLHYAYNKLGNLYLAQSNYDSAYLCHKIALDLSLKKQNKVNYQTASSYQNLGIASQMKGDYNQAEACYTQSLHIKEQLFDKNDPALAKIYSNLGKIFYDLAKYDSALIYYDRSEQLLISKYSRNDLPFAHVYWNKGDIYTLKGDYIKAANYLLKACSILENNLAEDDQVLLKALLDLGFAYEKKGDTLLAIEYYHKAAKSRDNSGIIKIYRNLGNLYQGLNERDSAEKYYHLSINYAQTFFTGPSHDLGLCYQYYGEFLAKSGQGEKSMDYYLKAEEIFELLFGRKSNKDLAKVYLLESQYYSKKSDFDLALKKIQEAIVTLLPASEQLDLEKNLTVGEITFDLYLPDFLRYKAEALYQKFNSSNKVEDLILSLGTIHLTLTVIEDIRKTYNDEESQLILNKEARSIIDLGVMINLKLNSLTRDKKFLSDAFQFSEKSQSIILLSALRGLQAQSTIDIPKGTQDIENNLLTDLSTFNNFIYQENQKKNPDKSKTALWSDKVFSLRLSYDSMLSSYKKLYPEFFRLKYDYSTIPADSLLKWLPSDQAIIEYHFSDSLLYCFVLADHILTSVKCGKKDTIIQNLNTLLQQFSRQDYFNAGPEEFKTITSVSSNLYDILIRPFESKIKDKRLVIIPDGQLGYLSFDLLLSSKVNEENQSYSDLPWLIKCNPISYSSSATIFFEQSRNNPGKVSSDLLAFAPSYDFYNIKRNGNMVDSVMLNLSPLTGTKEEIHSIAGLIKTKKRFDDAATEDYFKEHAGNYGILHLAMHTIINNDNPLYSKLVFSPAEKGSHEDGYLNTYELFRLHLKGQLAVLSACNTGGGKLESGEGIISLARGFFYAGIPSVIMTLWEIEDHSSANLMALFYEYLKKGYPKDVALQLAKVSYLEKAGKLHGHPYFWAGYVSIGKTDTIKFNQSNKVFYLFVLGFAALLATIFIYLFINNRVFFHKKRH